MTHYDFDGIAPLEQAPGPLLAYPQHHFKIQRHLKENYSGEELIAEERLQTAVARSAARVGLSFLPLKDRRALFPMIKEEKARYYSMERHWKDVRDAVSISATSIDLH
jgi:hypothetical protein